MIANMPTNDPYIDPYGYKWSLEDLNPVYDIGYTIHETVTAKAPNTWLWILGAAALLLILRNQK